MEDVRRRSSLLDRFGDPAAPSRYGRRRRDREREQPGPPKPLPPDPFGPEPEDELLCVRCCTTPVVLAWSQADNRLIHANVIGAPLANGASRICGGIVLRKGEEWRLAFAPGIIVPCMHSGAGLKAHLVRLGRPADNGGPSWSGTALCGVTNPGRHRNWRPLYPAAAAQADTCAGCKDAYLAETPSAPPQATGD